MNRFATSGATTAPEWCARDEGWKGFDVGAGCAGCLVERADQYAASSSVYAVAAPPIFICFRNCFDLCLDIRFIAVRFDTRRLDRVRRDVRFDTRRFERVRRDVRFDTRFFDTRRLDRLDFRTDVDRFDRLFDVRRLLLLDTLPIL
jgi:hypothetical protein